MKRLKSGCRILGIASLVLISSCVVTKAEGEQMSSDIARLKNEIATLQREKSDFTIVIERKNSELQSRISALEDVTFKKSTGESLESDRLKKEVEQLRGQLEETQKNFEDLQKVPKPEETVKDTAVIKSSGELESDIPTDKKGHFDWAKKAFADKNFNAAFLRIDSYIEKYRDDQQHGAEAHLLKGDSAVMLAKKAATEAAKKDLYKKAVVSYQELLTRYPKSAKIPEGLFKVGETLEAMGFASDAKIFYEEITLKHPKSAFAKDAKSKLAVLAKKKK